MKKWELINSQLSTKREENLEWKPNRLRPASNVTECGDLSPFWQFSECFGNLFFQKLPKNGVLMLMFWRLKNLFIYCSDKFGDFCQMLATFSSEHLVTLPASTTVDGLYFPKYMSFNLMLYTTILAHFKTIQDFPGWYWVVPTCSKFFPSRPKISQAIWPGISGLVSGHRSRAV